MRKLRKKIMGMSPNLRQTTDKSLSKDEIRTGISVYAAENRAEFEAECFLEMQMPNPRPLAKKWWEFMQEAVKAGF